MAPARERSRLLHRNAQKTRSPASTTNYGSPPLGSSKKHSKSTSIFKGFWLPKLLLKCSQNPHKTELESRQNRVGIQIGFALHFSLFLAPEITPTTPENNNIAFVKQQFPQIGPFAFDRPFWYQKVIQNNPKTIPTSLQNSSERHIENQHKI